MVFRFGNGIFEPIWNRRYIDHVQITVAETLGVEMRGGYYEQAGALRDMVPNHLFQVLTLTAMEPPSSLAAEALHNEQAKVLDAIEPWASTTAAPPRCVRNTPAERWTASACVATGRSRASIRHRRPKRTRPSSSRRQLAVGGRAVLPADRQTAAKKKSEVVIEFKQPPLALFRQASMAPPEANQLVISIQPEETIKLRLSVKVPGPDVTASPVDMRFNYADYFGVEHDGLRNLALRRDDRRSQSLQARRHRRRGLGRCRTHPEGLDAWRMRAGDVPAGSDGAPEADELSARGSAVETVVNGPRPTVHGLRFTAYGSRPTVHGVRSTVHGQRSTANGLRPRPTVHGRRSTVDDYGHSITTCAL